MAFEQVDSERWKITDSEIYYCHPHHRNGDPEKSQWAISRLDEVNVFAEAPRDVCSNLLTRWGLNIADNQIAELGTNGEWLAKFISDGADVSQWHGWPACRWPQDRPDQQLLEYWVVKGTITRARARRIERGIWHL